MLVLPPQANHNNLDPNNDIMLPIKSLLQNYVFPLFELNGPLLPHPKLSAVLPFPIPIGERGGDPIFSFSSIISALLEVSVGASASIADGSRRVDAHTTNMSPNPTESREEGRREGSV